MAVPRTAIRALTWLCGAGAGLAMASVFAIVFVNSLRRYTIGKSFEWGEELPIYLTIYGIVFGMGLAYLQDRHIRFTVVTDFLPKRMCARLYALIDLLMIPIGLSFAWSGWLFASTRGGVDASGIIGTAKSLSAATGLEWIEAIGRMGAWQTSMILAGIILALAALAKFVERVSDIAAEA